MNLSCAMMVGGVTLLMVACEPVYDSDDTTRDTTRDTGTIDPPDADMPDSTAADQAISRQVRDAIAQAEGLSTEGRNILVSTLNGHVTIRGTVVSDEESDRIETIAKSIAGENNVENDLDVEGEIG